MHREGYKRIPPRRGAREKGGYGRSITQTDGKQASRYEIHNSVLHMSQAPSSDNHSATELQVSDDMTAMVDIIGSDYIDEDLQNAACLQENSCVHNVGDDCLTKRELESIRAHIGSTNRPSWHRGPPLNFGEAAHG